MLSFVVAGLCLALMGTTALAQQEEPNPSSAVAPTAIEFNTTNDMQRWMGGSVEGILTITLANTSNEAVAGAAGTALVGNRTIFLPKVDLAAGQTRRVSIDVNLGGMSLHQRDIVATVGDTDITATDRSIPWLVVTAAALAVNGLLLAARNRLRNMVRRRVEAGTLRVPLRY